MIYKRLIYALLYKEGNFHLSRNFSLQKVGNVKWLKDNFGFGDTCDSVDELMIINVSDQPFENVCEQFVKDVNELRKKIFVPIILGGGIRTLEHAKILFANGADKVLINYLAHQQSNICESISKVYGEQALSIMVDYKKVDGEFKTFTNNGLVLSNNLESFIESLKNLKFGELILNSIDNDGTASGLDLECLKVISLDFKHPLLLMGGAGKPEHFTIVLSEKKISGIVTANLFNFLGRGLEEARNYSIEKNIKLIQFKKTNL